MPARAAPIRATATPVSLAAPGKALIRVPARDRAQLAAPGKALIRVPARDRAQLATPGKAPTRVPARDRDRPVARAAPLARVPIRVPPAATRVALLAAPQAPAARPAPAAGMVAGRRGATWGGGRKGAGGVCCVASQGVSGGGTGL